MWNHLICNVIWSEIMIEKHIKSYMMWNHVRILRWFLMAREMNHSHPLTRQIIQNDQLVGGLNPCEKYESQLGWLATQYMDIYGKINKWQPNHQPVKHDQATFHRHSLPAGMALCYFHGSLSFPRAPKWIWGEFWTQSDGLRRSCFMGKPSGTVGNPWFGVAKNLPKHLSTKKSDKTWRPERVKQTDKQQLTWGLNTPEIRHGASQTQDVSRMAVRSVWKFGRVEVSSNGKFK